MEEKPDKKKESIDEILSDLNGLLNKMPSILDGIKMPEMQPMEAPWQEPQESAAVPPETPGQPPAAEDDKTVVLQPFAGLEEGSLSPAAEQLEKSEPQPEPAIEPAISPAFEPVVEAAAEPVIEPAPEPAPSIDAEKTVILEAFSGLPEGSSAPEPEQLSPQSLGDFMFGENAEQGQEPEPAFPAGPAELSGSAPEPQEEPAPVPAALPPYDSTRDFGIPDIDVLMQMSDSGQAPQEEPAQKMPEAGVIPESVQAVEEDRGFSIQGLDEAPPVQPVSEGGIVEANEPKEERLGIPQPAEAFPAQEPVREDQQQPLQAESPFDAFAIDSSSNEAAPAQDSEKQPEPAAEIPRPEDGSETLRVEPSVEMPQEPAGVELLSEPAPEPAQGGGGMNFETAAESAAQASSGGIELSPGIEPGGQPRAEAAEQPQAGSAPGGAGLELSVGRPEGADQTMPGGSGLELGGGDATLVVAPSGSSSGEEEKTVIFQASQPSTTSRAQAGDLDGLAAKQAPEGIPAERLRTLMFLYSAEDKALCATALAELDAICLKSSTKPMFIKRAAVRECDPDANANFILQSMTDAGAQGLVCLGAVPQEKVYEIENVFNTSGGFFRYYDSSTFSHSAALDLVTDIILR